MEVALVLEQLRHPRNVVPPSPPNSKSSFVVGVLELEYEAPRRVKTHRHARRATKEMRDFMALIFPPRSMTIQEESPWGDTQVVTMVTSWLAILRNRCPGDFVR
jgi:hypothetical protein